MKLKTKVVQKAIVLYEGKILLLRRSETDVRRPLQWDLPGGLLDEGEELYTGIAREVQEEAGLEFLEGHVVYSESAVSKWIGEDGKKQQTNNVWLYYAGKSMSAKIILSYEHSECKWVSIEEAIKMTKYDRQKRFLQHVIDNQLEL